MYYLAVFCASFLVVVFLYLARNVFYSMAIATVRLLDVMLDSDLDENLQHTILLKRVPTALIKLLLFIAVLILSFSIAFFPPLAYVGFDFSEFQLLDSHSWKFILALLLGGGAPMILLRYRKKGEAYSEMSTLLHELILDNYNVHQFLFKKKQDRTPLEKSNEFFVIISGLARSGTTAITTLLYESQKFHSPTYASMPFLLSPKLWSRFYKPKSSNLTERVHGDKVLFGYDTIEAFEEYFFKAFLKDNYISEEDIKKHSITDRIFSDYLTFQNSFRVKEDTIYLAKNNNLILRYESFRLLNKSFLTIFMFRNPIEHAYSLLKQHQQFNKLQEKDPFVLKYMNWLGHFEFGQGHRPFDLNKETNNYSKNSIEYWLSLWIDYYTELLRILEADDNVILIQYNDFLKDPEAVFELIQKEIKQKLKVDKIIKLKNTNKYQGIVDSEVEKRAMAIFKVLKNKKRAISSKEIK